MTKPTHLLLIDPQNDFCDHHVPDIEDAARAGVPVYTPALPVPGAAGDMERLAQFIGGAGHAIDAITVTLDSHHRLDIAHPHFWRTGAGADVAPFTQITLAQFNDNDYVPRDLTLVAQTRQYLARLAERGRYTLMVWPTHCELGTWGHNVHDDVRAAYGAWEVQRGRSVDKVLKGLNKMTEHYSAIEAEVPDAADLDTFPNMGLVIRLQRAGRIIVAGEASSHCVRATVEDFAHLTPGYCKTGEFILLTDAMSPVTGFKAQQEAFFERMKAWGARLATTQEMERELAEAAA